LAAVAACAGEPAGAPRTTADASTLEVTVDGRVERAIDRHVFEVGGDATTPVVVVWRRPEPVLQAGVVVQVTGTVTTFDVGTIERRLGIDLADHRVASVRGKDVLVARELTIRAPDAEGDRMTGTPSEDGKRR
jgi:hypothetical protein